MPWSSKYPIIRSVAARGMRWETSCSSVPSASIRTANAPPLLTKPSKPISRTAVPILKDAPNPHILSLSPPLNITPRWLGAHPGYTLAKYGMTMATLGFAAEFADDGIAANTLWPETTIATAAVQFALGGDRMMKVSRTPEVYADAAYEVLLKPSREYTGQTLIVEEVLRDAGVTDFSGYAAVPGTPDSELFPDIFL